MNKWRTIDIVIASVVAVAFGVIFWAWGLLWNGPADAIPLPGRAVLYGMWLVPAVLGALIVRKPGAAFYTLTLASLVSVAIGTSWGWTLVVQGPLEALGAELAFAIFGYKAFGAAVAVLAGVLSAPLEWAFEVVSFPASWADVPVLSVFANGGGWYAEWVLRDKLVYLGAMAVSGAVLAGFVGWLLVRALARAGALSAFPAGQEHRESHAV